MNSLEKIVKSKKALLLALLAIIPGINAQAQTAADAASSEFLFYVVVGMVFFVALLVLITAIFTLRVLNVIVNKQLSKKAAESGTEVEEEPSMMSSIMEKLTDRAPMEKEKDILLDHNYDGIKELDNHLPPWWLYLFYFTIVFGIVYLLAYHVFDTLPLQQEEYENSLIAATKDLENQPPGEVEVIDENTIVFEDNATMIEAGKKVYNLQCASCHATDGGGIVGPNLTDEYWIHGGGIQNVFKTVKYGVVEKGMIAWEGVISPKQMRDVSIYIMTLEGTTPANPKAPQGEIWQGGDETESEDAGVEADSTATEETEVLEASLKKKMMK